MSKFTYRQLLVVGTILAGITTVPMYGEAEELETQIEDVLILTPESQKSERQAKVGKSLITAQKITVTESTTKVVTSQPALVEQEAVIEVSTEMVVEEHTTTQEAPAQEATLEVDPPVIVSEKVEEFATETNDDELSASKTATLVAAENVAQLAKVDPTNEKTKTTVAAGYGQTIGELFTDPNFANEIANLLGVEDINVVLTEELANNLTEINLPGKQISNIGATRFLVKS